MNADRIDYYTNQLRGVPVSDLGRKLREVLRDATKEAKEEENEACAKFVETQRNDIPACGFEFAEAIRARRNHG